VVKIILFLFSLRPYACLSKLAFLVKKAVFGALAVLLISKRHSLTLCFLLGIIFTFSFVGCSPKKSATPELDFSQFQKLDHTVQFNDETIPVTVYYSRYEDREYYLIKIIDFEYSIDEWQPGKALLLDTHIGDGSTRGISFLDRNNRTRFFTLYIGDTNPVPNLDETHGRELIWPAHLQQAYSSF
jgi:hypothetical protein